MLSINAERLLSQRYYLPNETWEGLCRRVIDDNCRNESTEYKTKMYEYIYNTIFLPNSPALVNSGRISNGKFACFVAGPTEDNLENQLDTLKDIAQIEKKGGGCGFTGTLIRPKNKPVAGSAHGYSYGPNAYAGAVSNYMDMMTQAGFRKMALMYTLDCEHEDIEDFINLKQNRSESDLYNFNQSVMASDLFMKKAESDKNNKERQLLNKIALNAWNNGEPKSYWA